MLIRTILRIVVEAGVVSVHLAVTGLVAMLGGAVPAADTQIVLSASVQRTRWRREVRLLVRGAAGQTKPNPSLIRLVVKAHDLWVRLLAEGSTITAIAQREDVTGSYVTRLIRLASLAPDITAAILNGQQPGSMTAETLLRHSRLPLAWADQRMLLGFDPV